MASMALAQEYLLFPKIATKIVILITRALDKYNRY
jgi:hypothetical protein